MPDRDRLLAHPDRALSCTNTKALLDHQNFDAFATALRGEADELASIGFVVLVPAQMLDVAAAAFDGTGIGWGTQNVWRDASPPTGEIAAEALVHAGCRYAMVGHPERRARLAEDDTTVAGSAASAAEQGITPIVCVGEQAPTAAEAAVEAVVRQARPVADAHPAGAPLVWLYEPPWTSEIHQAAPPSQVAVVCETLRNLGAERTDDVRVLYGGAVVPGVLPALLDAGCRLDGLGVGKAAYDTGQRQAVTAELAAAAREAR
ncbi:triose-phosphate isomerase family protein, partial [Streptomyces sp. NPDC005012]|uniref:triose-phosphate isomerase n=1 Tax=Streptomyces sp. NPDC005012 TaxID=3154558 RepID=UPI0033B4F469